LVMALSASWYTFSGLGALGAAAAFFFGAAAAFLLGAGAGSSDFIRVTAGGSSGCGCGCAAAAAGWEMRANDKVVCRFALGTGAAAAFASDSYSGRLATLLGGMVGDAG
jgi:hypothetical protein